jgi:hypothetical protein
MFSFKRTALLPLLAAAASVAMAATPFTSASAATGPRVSMTRLNERIDKLPELSALKAGDTLTIYDDSSATAATWEGAYTYYPAGSKVPMRDMYARWKDGLVTIRVHTDPADAGDDFIKDVARPFATYIEQQYGTGKNSDDEDVIAPVSEAQVTKRLIQEPTDQAVLRIPNNAFLFRDEGNGQYTALVDVFVFNSGSTPVQRVSTAYSDEWIENGAQPVAVTEQE